MQVALNNILEAVNEETCCKSFRGLVSRSRWCLLSGHNWFILHHVSLIEGQEYECLSASIGVSVDSLCARFPPKTASIHMVTDRSTNKVLQEVLCFSASQSKIAQTFYPLQPKRQTVTVLSHQNQTSSAYKTLLNAGINVCASQKEKTSFGPVMSSFGTNPLKNDEAPSFFAMFATILNPLSGFSKFRF